MTGAPSFLESLRKADRALASVHIGAGASHRIRTAIRRQGTHRPDRQRVRPFAALLLVASAAAIAFLYVGRTAPLLGQATSASSGCVTTAAGDSVDLTGPCTLNLPTMQIETSGTTTLSETVDGVRLLKGMATFQVRPVPPGHAPVRVRVSGGTIEIVGTKFIVEQKDGGGSIHLLEGTIRFVFASGRESVLHAGERLNWIDDLPAPPTSAVQAPPTRTTLPPVPPMGDVTTAEPFHEEHPSLREAQERFDEVGREARYTEAERLREKLEPASFELGGALEQAHVEVARICAHWRWHTKRFPAGIYNGDIEDRMRKLGCQR